MQPNKTLLITLYKHQNIKTSSFRTVCHVRTFNLAVKKIVLYENKFVEIFATKQYVHHHIIIINMKHLLADKIVLFFADNLMLNYLVALRVA